MGHQFLLPTPLFVLRWYTQFPDREEHLWLAHRKGLSPVYSLSGSSMAGRREADRKKLALKVEQLRDGSWQ